MLSIVCFFGMYGWGIAVQDAGAAVRAAGWLELALQFGLLQPLAHWVLDWMAIAWWTWPGLIAMLLLVGINSLAVSSLLAAVLALVRHCRGR